MEAFEVRIEPVPLGEVPYLPPKAICFSNSFDTSHPDGGLGGESCAHCVPTELYDEVEELFLGSQE